MVIADRVRELVAPLTEAASVELYDVEHHGSMVRVLVDAEGGVGIDTIARLSRSLSCVLDEHDLVPGRYTLEVSSPGLERPLRTPDHFRRAVGTAVKVKTLPSFDGPRRVAGVLDSVAYDGVGVRDAEGLVHRIGYHEVASARTVFDWGADRNGRSRSIGEEAKS